MPKQSQAISQGVCQASSVQVSVRCQFTILLHWALRPIDWICFTIYWYSLLDMFQSNIFRVEVQEIGTRYLLLHIIIELMQDNRWLARQTDLCSKHWILLWIWILHYNMEIYIYIHVIMQNSYIYMLNLWFVKQTFCIKCHTQTIILNFIGFWIVS